MAKVTPPRCPGCGQGRLASTTHVEPAEDTTGQFHEYPSGRTEIRFTCGCMWTCYTPEAVDEFVALLEGSV